MLGIWTAIGFLTTLPVPSHDLRPDALRNAGVWFPPVGLVIGCILATGASAAAMFFPPMMTATLVTALWAAITGGLHLDGLADCGDGLLPPVSRGRRLEIMRDPRVGAFGVTVLVLVLLLKTASLAALPSMWPALVVAPVWARWLILIAARRPSARSEGMGASLGPALQTKQLALAALLPVAATVIVSFWYSAIWLAVAAAILSALGVLRLAEKRLGGVTGDVFGAIVEVSEMVLLCISCIRLMAG